MTASPRFIAFLSALFAIAPVFAHAAEQVSVPIGWKTGEVSTYDTESIVRDAAQNAASIRRITDRTRIRTENVDDRGYTLIVTTHDSRAETMEGDRSMVDSIAPVLDELDGMEVAIELDRDGRYRRVRNLETVVARMRAVMLPVFIANLPDMFGDNDPKLSKYERDESLAAARRNLEASIGGIITPQSVETMSSAQIKTMTAFAGMTLEVGKRYRDAEPLDSPSEGRPLPASREYVLSLVDGEPDLARIRWTHSLDLRASPKTLWLLVDELVGNQGADARRGGRPDDLVLRKEGMLLFRRDTGAVEMLETTETSRYGAAHDENERYRMRRSGSARTWAQEEAAKP